MNGHLFDTNVLSELRKGSRANANLTAWGNTIDRSKTFLSVLTLGEIRRGIELIGRRDPQQASQLDSWLNIIENDFADRILPVTREICDCWGRISARRPLATIDGLLAATALTHDLILVTRNTRDIHDCGVSFVNPFETG